MFSLFSLSTSLCIPKRLLLSLSLTAVLTSAVSGQHAMAASDTSLTVEKTKRVKRVEPIYPRSAARNQQEGWVRFFYSIDEEGRVKDIEADDYFGNKEFVTEGRKALRQWRFQPRIENGVAVKQTMLSVELNFLLKDKKGIDSHHKSLIKRANQALQANELDKAKEYLDRMDLTELYNLTEQNFYHHLSATYAEKMGQTENVITHLNKIILGDHLIKPSFKLSVLKGRFLANIKLNRLSEATKNYKQLKKLDVAKPYLPTFKNIVEQVNNKIKGSENIMVAANLKQKNYWRHYLVRKTFSLENIKGQINKVTLHCRGTRYEYEVNEQQQWSLPEPYKRCILDVHGDKSSQFTLVEHAQI